MATIIKTHPASRWRPGTLAWLGRQMLLVPELLSLPAVFLLYQLTQRPVALAIVGEVLIALFGVRTLLLWRASRAIDAGHYQRALRYVRWAGWLHPWSADTAALHATATLALGYPAQSVAAWHLAIKRFPGHAPFYVGLSAALVEDGELTEARWAVLQALALHPDAIVYAQLADVTLRLYDNASITLEVIRTGLAATPSAVAQALLYTLQAEAALLNIDHRTVRTALNQATSLLIHCTVPVQAELLYRLSQVRRQLGDVAIAIYDFERIEQIDPEGRLVGPAWRAAREAALV